MAVANVYDSQDVKCPFYKYEKERRLYCEAPIDEATLILAFQKKSGIERQREIFCCEHYEKCEIYRATLEKYED